jgi:hypothetical protein
MKSRITCMHAHTCVRQPDPDRKNRKGGSIVRVLLPPEVFLHFFPRRFSHVWFMEVPSLSTVLFTIFSSDMDVVSPAQHSGLPIRPSDSGDFLWWY